MAIDKAKVSTIAYSRYENGLRYNQKINYYAKSTENENMINGDQWGSVDAGDLPKPVFNVEKRVMDFKIASIMSQRVKGVYQVESVEEYSEDLSETQQVYNEVAKMMSGNAEIMWEKMKMDTMLRQALRDGFITGDMCVYTYWDQSAKTGQKAKGNFVSELVFGGNVFFGNPNEPDVQKQPYVILLKRDTVDNLREKAKANGASKEDLELIYGDDDTDTQTGNYGKWELEGDESTKKTNSYIMFYRKDGKVMWSESTRYVTIRKDVELGISRYPIAWANWDLIRNSYHGKAECAEIHPNQRFINKMFAMCMIWFMYNSFGKVAYDATRISGWTNEIGVAVPVQGAVDGVVQQLASGDFNNAVLMVIDYAIKYTKDFLGATDASLGEVRADNTSAIIMVQKASAVPLENQQYRLYQFVEDILLIWAEFMLNKYAEGRLVPMKQDGQVIYKPFTQIDKEKMLLNVKIEVGASSYWNEILAQQTLDNLLMQKIITPIQYLERQSNGVIPNKQQLIDEMKAIAMYAPIGQGEQLTAQVTDQATAQVADQGYMPRQLADPNQVVGADYEAMAQFFESLPQEIQTQLNALPPDQMEAQLVAMMQ